MPTFLLNSYTGATHPYLALEEKFMNWVTKKVIASFGLFTTDHRNKSIEIIS
jgi:hypothetical protein